MPKKKGDKGKLTPTDKEVIIQTHAATGNKAETARRCGVAWKTVHEIVKAADDGDIDLKEARRSAASKLTGRVHVLAENLIDSITPEELESGRIAIRDKDGQLVGYKTYGPSLLQKTTSIGIIVDKGTVLQAYEKGLEDDVNAGKLLLPSDIEGLIGACRAKIGELTVLNVKFADENPTILKETQEIVAEVERIEEREANKPEIDAFDEFDNP
jgi:hypothetical protein